MGTEFDGEKIVDVIINNEMGQSHYEVVNISL